MYANQVGPNLRSGLLRDPTGAQSVIPYRYAQTGMDLPARFDRSQHTPYERQQFDNTVELEHRNFLDPNVMKRHDPFLGRGSREDNGVNRSVHAVPNHVHAQNVVFEPTPQALLAPGEMDDFWVDHHLFNNGAFQLKP